MEGRRGEEIFLREIDLRLLKFMHGSLERNDYIEDLKEFKTEKSRVLNREEYI